MFYFTCNHDWNLHKIISAADGVLKLFEFQNILATLNMLENIHELQ